MVIYSQRDTLRIFFIEPTSLEICWEPGFLSGGTYKKKMAYQKSLNEEYFHTIREIKFFQYLINLTKPKTEKLTFPNLTF